MPGLNGFLTIGLLGFFDMLFLFCLFDYNKGCGPVFHLARDGFRATGCDPGATVRMCPRRARHGLGDIQWSVYLRPSLRGLTGLTNPYRSSRQHNSLLSFTGDLVPQACPLSALLHPTPPQPCLKQGNGDLGTWSIRCGSRLALASCRIVPGRQQCRPTPPHRASVPCCFVVGG